MQRIWAPLSSRDDSLTIGLRSAPPAASADLPVPPFSLPDLAWRTVFRLGFPVARLWWRLRRASHEGALVAIHVGPALLLVRSSYRRAWNFPGGGVRPGEAPEAAARRELSEEIGLTVPALHPAGTIDGFWDGRRDRVHLFECASTGRRPCGSTIARSSRHGWSRRRSCVACR